MQLFELGKQYEDIADILLQRIHELRKASQTLQGTDQVVMQRRILSLYKDSADCKMYAAILKNYRKDD